MVEKFMHLSLPKLACTTFTSGAVAFALAITAVHSGAEASPPPGATDVFASSLVSTVDNPQSGLVVLEGSDNGTDELTYSVLIAPSHGTLRDPEDSDAVVTSGNIAGKTLRYTPNIGFAGIDTFLYRVAAFNPVDGTTFTSAVASISVFDAYRDNALQLGADIDGDNVSEESGAALALSSDGLTMAVGAPSDSVGGDASGRTRIYRYDGDVWLQLGGDINGTPGSSLGYAVSLSSDGQTVAIGAPEFGVGAEGPGQAFVYRFNGSDWVQLGEAIAGDRNLDRAGESVAVSGDGQIVAVGATGHDSGIAPLGQAVGRTRIYRYDGNAWIQLGNSIDGEADGDASGRAVTLSADGQTVAIGESGHDAEGADNAGRARVFTFNGSAWVQVGGSIVGEADGDGVAMSLSLASDGQTLAMGASRRDVEGASNVGYTRVFRFDGVVWSQLGTDIEGESEGDLSGASVTLSSDARTLAIGAPEHTNDSFAQGLTRIYRYEENDWVKVSMDILGEREDLSGNAVALSADGLTVAIGAPHQQGGFTADTPGVARVFNLALLFDEDDDGDGVINGDDQCPFTPPVEPSLVSSQGCTLSQIDFPPVAMDVFASSLVNTLESPQSTLLVLEGSDTGGDPLSYTVLSGPTHGTLRDPVSDEPVNATVISQDISGNTLKYTPNLGFSGTDTFIYLVSDGTSTSDATVTVAVFDALRGTANQLGVDIDGEAALDESGTSVAISRDGQTVAIGAPFNDAEGTNSAGQTRIYRFDSGTWVQLGSDIDGEAAGDESGGAVDLSSDGRTVAIGARMNDGAGGDAGHTRIYRYDGSDWEQLGGDIDGETAEDLFGSSIALSSDGETVAIGAPGSNAGGDDAGEARVFRYDGREWVQFGRDLPGFAGYRAGASVSLSSDGQTVAIGSPGGNGFGGSGDRSERGVTFIYRYDDDWSLFGSAINGEEAFDAAGTSVSLSGDGQMIAIGAPSNDNAGDEAGHTRVYRALEFGGTTAWVQLGADIDGKAVDDEAGTSVSLSSDGRTVAIGAPNQETAGHARVYRYDGIAWSQLSMDIDGEASFDKSGVSVALSGDGQTVAIGARTNDAEGSDDAGHVRVFDLTVSPDEDDDGDGVTNDLDICPMTPSPEAGLVDGVGCGPLEIDFPPVATDVFASSLVNTEESPESTIVVLDGSDAGSDPLTYSILSAPAHGTLRDPDTGNTVVIGVTLAGNSLRYVPDINVTGIDTFTYRVSDGIASSDATVTVSVFAAYQDQATDLSADIDGEAAFDQSGTSVAISRDGQTIAVGAPFNDTANGDNTGHTRIYRHDGTAWLQVGQDIDGEGPNDSSGTSVALSSDGQTVAIGAPLNDAPAASDAGHTRVYRYDGSSWIQLGAEIDGESDGDRSGTSVALSSDGRTVAIGAPLNNADGANDAGHTRVYRYDGSRWIKLGSDIDGEAINDQSGSSVALSSDGQTIAIGALFNDGAGASNAGHARVYRYEGSDWVQLGTDIDGANAGDASGGSVSLSSDGQTVAIGVRLGETTEGRTGLTRVYRYEGSDWVQIGDDIDGEADGDFSGFAVSLSSNGQTIAIGAQQNDAEGAEDAGHTRIYRFDGSNWAQIIPDIDGEAAGDRSGTAVALSGDGQTVAVGAALNGGAGERAGHVRIFDLTGFSVDDDGDGVPNSFDQCPGTPPVGSRQLDAQGCTLSQIDFPPVAVNVYASSLMNPETTVVVLAGSDLGSDSLIYSVVSAPVNGTLRDPQNRNALVTLGDIAGSTLQYTPDAGFVGSDTFFYRVSDGTRSSEARVTLQVFNAYAEQALQLGQDIDGEAARDTSGVSVAVSGDGQTVAIGATGNDGSGNSSGHTRIYRHDGSGWTQLGSDIDGDGFNDESGRSVALSSDGRAVAIGAPQSAGLGNRPGYARVYFYNGTDWSQLGTSIDGEADGDESGFSVSLSADGLTVAIGAPFAVGVASGIAGGSPTGHTRVYRYDGSTWLQLGSDIDGESVGDESGSSVALAADGQIVAIGAPGNDAGGERSGQTRMYRFNGSEWSLLGTGISGEALGDESGTSVSLSGDGQTVAIGAPRNSGRGDLSGHTRIYRFDGKAWRQLGADINGEATGDVSGTSVSLSSNGQIVAIGAPDNAGGGELSGQTRIYRFDGRAWQQVGADIDGEAASDESGISVALAGNGQRVVIGAPFNDANGDTSAGHVRIYDLIVPPDEDGDGIPNDTDQCPDTPEDEASSVDAVGCAPSQLDFDSDGVSDALDAFPNDPSETEDTDGDGLGDNREVDLGTDPNSEDTDGDGFSDLEEVEAGSDPLSADDVPSFGGINILLIKAAIDARAP